MKKIILMAVCLVSLATSQAFAQNTSTPQNSSPQTPAASQNSKRPNTKRPARPISNRRNGTYVTSSIDWQWASRHSRWDLSPLFGIYNPGFGVSAILGFRILNSVLPHVDDSLSLELGLGYISATTQNGGQTQSYSLIEIPVMARWDIRPTNTHLTLAPRAGITYLSGNNIVVNGNTYSTRGGNTYLQIGFAVLYQFDPHWALRTDVMTIGFTSFNFGATYFF